MDPSLGSLPTLIVPDDPETGAIERPKTPPPVVVDEARLASTSAAPKAKEPSIKSPREPSIKSPREPQAKSPREPQAKSPREPSVKSPREASVKSPREPSVKSPREPQVKSPREPSAKNPSVKSPRDPSHHSAAHQSQAIAVDFNSPRPENQPQDDATATPAVPPAPPSPLHKAPTVSSKDFKTMAKRAAALAKLDRLAAGSKSVFDVKMDDIGALGIGMQLYFMLTKYLGVVFLTMGIISLPTIVVNYFGDGITTKMADPLQLAYASLGNQGVSDEIKQDTSLCLPDGEIDCTWETVNTPFTTSPVTVSWIITSSDAIYSFVFLMFVVYFRVQARKAIELHQAENLTPAKYSIFVRGLPPDATKREILEHFNSRFDPTQEEQYFPLWLNCCWGRRRKVKNSLSRKAVNCNVVSNIEHLTGSTTASEADAEMYIGTWIAEVSVAHPTGGLLRTFLSMEALTRNIAETEELITILEREKKEAAEAQAERDAAIAAADAATAKKLRRQKLKATFKLPDEKLLQSAQKKLEKLNAQMEKKTSKIKAFKQQQREDRVTSMKKSNTATVSAVTPVASATVAPAPSPNDPPQAPGLARQGTVKLNVAAVKKAAADTVKAFNLEACECAFVVFNNLESRRRCLRDYRKSTRWLPRKYQPKFLRFRDGKFPLIVVAAPEPSNILWENLEITDRGRLYRRSFTNFVTFLLLLFSCIIISGAQSAQQQFKAKMPPAGLCDHSLPAVYYGSYSFDDQHSAATKNLVWELEWDRNETCTVGSSGEARYHIAYSNGIINDLNVSSLPKVKSGDSAPVRCVDPCVSDESSTTCSTLPCFDQDLLDEGDECETYMASHSLYCLCTTQLQASINELGIIDGPQALWKDFEPCQGFIKDYLTKNAFIVVASGIVVIVNLLLKTILRAFATFERHSSESAKASAITLKMFMAQFLNTAIIVLVVNTALNLNKVPLVSDLFKGKYHDFERDWYPTVGMAITMTMLINAFVPHIVLCLQMFIISPIMRLTKRRSIRTQQQMDKLYAGPSFDISVRYPMVLNSVFVTMIFSGGSPVLLFIAALTCGGTFWFDKLSILRMYSVKTAYDEELGETALNLLPWTLVLHLGFSAWMYGNPNLMKSSTLNMGVVFDAVGISVASDSQSSESAYDQLLAKASQVDILGQYGFVVKIVRANVMVMFLFCIILIVGIFLSAIWFQVLLPVLRKTVGVVLLACWKRIRVSCRCCCCRRKKRVKPVPSDSRSSVSRRSAKVAADNVTPEVVVAEAPAAQGEAPAASIPEDAPPIGEPATPADATPVDNTPTEPIAASIVSENKPPESEINATEGAGNTQEPPNESQITPSDSNVPPGDAQEPPSVDMIEMTVPKSARISAVSPEPMPDSTPTVPPIAPPAVAATALVTALSARLSARKKRPVVLPEFTDLFRKSVPRRFKPDTKLGFSIDSESDELVRCWKEETISNGRTRGPGEHMRTWEALQAPVKTYAIEANAKYRLAFAELVAASKRSRSASAVLSKVDLPIEAADEDHPTTPGGWTDLAAVPPAEHTEPALVGEEPTPVATEAPNTPTAPSNYEL